MTPEFYARLNDALRVSTEKDAFLSEQEIEILIISLATSRGSEGFTDEEAFKVIDWAQNQRIGSALLELVLKGLADINLVGDEPTFKITEEGERVYKGEENGFLN